jgi:hypothetical protein
MDAAVVQADRYASGRLENIGGIVIQQGNRESSSGVRVCPADMTP